MSKEKEFHVARELRVRLSDTGDFLASVSRSSGEFFLATELLLLLQEVQRSRRVDDGLASRLRGILARLEADSPSGEELGELVEELHGAGLLVAKEGRARKDALLEDGFGDPWIQWAMLADVRRGRAYEAAMGRAVDEGSVVVDVGAGTGLLSGMALRAGARKCLAIEETASARGIAPLLKKLGLPTAKPRFELFQGNSSEAPLPPGATLVVSELFGNDPFCEGVLPTLRDVGARLPLGKVRWIPASVEVFVEVAALLGSPVRERVAALWKARAEGAGPRAVGEGDFQSEFLMRAAEALPFFPLSFAVPLARSDLSRLGAPCSLGRVRLDPPAAPIVAFAGEKTFSFEPRLGLGGGNRSRGVLGGGTGGPGGRGRDRDTEGEAPRGARAQRTLMGSARGSERVTAGSRAAPGSSDRHSGGNAAAGEDPLVLVAWYRVALDARTSLSNHPAETDACGHWSPIVIPLAPSKGLRDGRLTVKFALSPFEDHLHIEAHDSQGARVGGR